MLENKEDNMPHELIIKFDQKGLKMVQTGEWILKVKESKDYSIPVLDHKREIHVTHEIGISMTVL